MSSVYEIEVNGKNLVVNEDQLSQIAIRISRKEQYSPSEMTDVITYAINAPNEDYNRAVLGFNTHVLDSNGNAAIKASLPAKIRVNGILMFEGICLVKGLITEQAPSYSYYRCFFQVVKVQWYTALNQNPLYGTLRPRPYYLCDIFPSTSIDYGSSLAGYTAAGIDATTGMWVNSGTGATTLADLFDLTKTPDIFFPAINYGDWQNIFTTTRGIKTVAVGDLKPAIRWVDIIVRAAHAVGYTVDNTSLAAVNDKFDLLKMICPYFGDRFNHTNDFMFANTISSGSGGGVVSGSVSPTEITNFGSPFYNAPDNGSYQFKVILNGTAQSSSGTIASHLEWSLESSVRGVINLNDHNLSFTTGLGTAFEYTIDVSIFLFKGETLKMYLQTGAANCTTTGGVTITVAPPLELSEGNNFDIVDVLDNTIPVSELIQDWITMFNVYCEVDTLKKVLYFETRDAFYGSVANAVDMSDKLDISQEQERDYYMDDYGQNIEIKFADDGNAYSQYYYAQFGYSPFGTPALPFQYFGEAIEQLNTGFQMANTVIELKHLVAVPMIYDYLVSNYLVLNIAPALLPTYWTAIQGSDKSRPKYSTKVNPSVLMFANEISPFSFGAYLFLYDSYNVFSTQAQATAYSIHPYVSSNLLFKSFKGYAYSSGAGSPYYMDPSTPVDMPGIKDLFHHNTIKDIRNGYLFRTKMKISVVDLTKNDSKLLWFLGSENACFAYEEIENLSPISGTTTQTQLKVVTMPDGSYLPLDSDTTEVTPIKFFPYLI